MDKNKAIVAIAHKLLIAVWHVLSEYTADKHAEPKMVATKLMRWSWDLTEEQRGGLTTREFIRLASIDELLAAHPEYRSLQDNPLRPVAL